MHCGTDIKILIQNINKTHFILVDERDILLLEVSRGWGLVGIYAMLRFGLYPEGGRLLRKRALNVFRHVMYLPVDL